jgi:hypothetical protein
MRMKRGRGRGFRSGIQVQRGSRVQKEGERKTCFFIEILTL